MFRRASSVLLLALVGLAAPSACSSSEGPAPFAATVKPPTDTSDAGDLPTTPPSTPPPTDPPVAGASERCTGLEELEDHTVFSSAFTNVDDAYLYVVVREDEPTVRDLVHRFKRVTESPCAFERDTAFEVADAGLALAVADTGAVFSESFGKLRRLFPGPLVECTATGVDSGVIWSIGLAPDGTSGVVAYADSASVDKLGIFTATADTCTVTAFVPGNGVEPGAKQVAVDTSGRLHVVDEKTPADGNKRIAIFDKAGTFVKTYNMRKNGPLNGPDNITRCKTGICILDFFDPVAFDNDGTFKSETKFDPGVPFAAPMMVGAAQGGLFVIASAIGGAGHQYFEYSIPRL